MLSIKNLSLTFLGQKSEAFHNVNLEVEESEILLITGKSGIGKSALLMCVAGVIPETYEGTISGDINFLGESLIHKSPSDISGEIAYMFQDSDSQLCTFTVEDEIAFGLENLLVDPREMEVQIESVLDTVGISHLRKCKVNELSGGEKQKVAFASILVMKPKLILMDEPTANLDPQSTRDMVQLIEKLNKETGTTFVIIEHKIDEFIHGVTRVVIMEKDGIRETSKEYLKREYVSFKEQLADSMRKKKGQEYSSEILKMDGIAYSYDGKSPCLDNLCLSVKAGQLFAIVGANGAGKSTLSKLIMGLLRPSKGEVIVGGKSLGAYKLNELGRSIGYVFQNPEHQFIKGSVEDELSLSLKIAGLKKEEIELQVKDYLKKFSLEELRTANPFMLSQGQKRRLSTASMLINGQPLLILDEPTYGQDQENLLSLVRLLNEVNQSGVTVIMITHDLLLMEYVTDGIAIMQQGRVVYSGAFNKELVQKYLLEGECLYEN